MYYFMIVIKVDDIFLWINTIYHIKNKHQYMFF